MINRYQETENLLNKMENYINNNKFWFCVGKRNLIQITKDSRTNMFKIRTNTKDYSEALENFLNDKPIEFTDWHYIDRNCLFDLINENRSNIDFQFSNFH